MTIATDRQATEPKEPLESEEPSMFALMMGRASLYGLLSRAFRCEVDDAFLKQLRAMHYPQNSDNPAINEAFRRLYAYMRHTREDTLDALSVDYSRTFLGSGVLNPYAAFPYESVYTSEHGLVMQEARDEVLAIYRSQGVNREESWTDPEDHIALELDFMRILSERCADALAAGDEEHDATAREMIAVQYSFLVNHLLRWVPNFAIDVPKYAKADFYPAFAQLTNAYLIDDKALLEDIALASSIDLEDAVEQATARDAAIDRDMEQEADQDHVRPTYVVTDQEPITAIGAE